MNRFIGEEIVIYPVKRNRKYISRKKNNGYKNQVFLRSDFLKEPTVFIYMGIEEKDGKYYEKFFQKNLPQKRLYYKGQLGKSKYKSELDSICSKLYKGRAADGRKICFARNITSIESRKFNSEMQCGTCYSNELLNFLYVNLKKEEDSMNYAPEPVIYLRIKKLDR